MIWPGAPESSGSCFHSGPWSLGGAQRLGQLDLGKPKSLRLCAARTIKRFGGACYDRVCCR